MYLTSEVVVVLRMGPDEVFSGGLDLTIRYDQCGPAPTTTTPEPQGPTTVVTKAPVPTTVSPAPPSVAPTTALPPAGPAILPVSGTSGLLITVAAGVALVLAGGLLKPARTIDATPLVTLTALAAALAAVGWHGFRNRDLAAN